MTRDDAFKFTREDVLRELELLPVWKLREPLPTKPVVEDLQPASVQNEAESTAKIEPIDHHVVQDIVVKNQESTTAVLIFSDDKKWLFVMPEALIGQAAELFNNILRALKIKPLQVKHTQQLTQDISGASVVVAMGETAALQLLNSAETIENLRGKLHAVNGVPVIVTYHPDELLQHLPNKAKTWDDLCMALSVINA